VPLDGRPSIDLGRPEVVRVAAASADWDVRVVQTGTNQVAVETPTGLRPLASIDKVISWMALSPRGDRVFLKDDTTLWVVPIGGGPPRALTRYDGRLRAVVESPDHGSVALVGDSPDVILITYATGEVRALRGHSDATYEASFTRDGRRLLTASDDGTARLWDLANGTSTVLRGHDDDVYRAHFSADERQVVTASLDGSVRVWPLDAPGVEIRRADAAIDDLLLVDDQLVAKTATAVVRWDAAGRAEELFAWGRDPHGLGVGLVSKDATQLLTLRADNALELHRRGGPTTILRGHTGALSHAEFGDDGRVYTSSIDGTLRRWDPATGQGTVLVTGKLPLAGFAVARDGRVAVRVGDDAEIISPDGRIAPLGHGAGWCIGSGEFDPVTAALILRRCDQTLAVVTRDGEVRELPTGGYLPVRTVVSPDGQRIAGAMGDRTVRVWNATTGEVLAVLRGHSDLVLDVAFAPDGRTLASASYDKTVRVWDLASGRARVLRGHAGAVDHVLWSRTGDAILSGSRDGTVRRWPLPSLELPTADALGAALVAATSATIDERDLPSTVTGSVVPVVP
jgi:WD40 repeat protein